MNWNKPDKAVELGAFIVITLAIIPVKGISALDQIETSTPFAASKFVSAVHTRTKFIQTPIFFCVIEIRKSYMENFA